jgi:hypothetical protein
MMLSRNAANSTIEICDPIIQKWQTIVDTMAEISDVPAGLIMRIKKDDIEVFVSSQSEENPYKVGDKEHLIGSGLYCEYVIKTKSKLLVPDARVDDKWKNNPDIMLDMISYLGFPIMLPDGRAFGTICVLDNKANAYSNTYEKLIMQFRDLTQWHLELLYMNQSLGEKNKLLSDYISEIKTLRGILPICSICKQIRDDKGYWNQIEAYIQEHSEAEFSHGICQECAKKYYPDMDIYDD